MSLVQQHLDELKNYQTPDVLDGVNKIYFLEVNEKPGLVKIGDTHREVETRNDETLTNASLHRTKPVTWVIAKKFNGSSFRDKRFHKFLENAGYERELNDNGSKSEWFFIELETALDELESFIGKPVYKEVQLRPAQHYLLDKIQDALDSGSQYINAGFCVRVGKTLISLKTSANNNFMPVYIGKNLTSQSSAEADNAEFGVVSEMLTQSLHGVDDLTSSGTSKRTTQIIKNIKKANVNNKKVIFFVDEVDDASHTAKSRAIITPVVKHFQKNKKFGAIIPMSGTRIYRGEKILREITDSDITELSLEYYEMQILQPETTCRREFRHISFYSQAQDGLANISDSMKTSEGRASISTVIEKLLSDNDFDYDVDANFPHWFMKFCTVGIDRAKSLVRYLNKNLSTIGDQEYLFAEINGQVTVSKEAQSYCKKIIADNPDKICVFISQGMATTSFSVTGIGNSAVFTDNEITSDDIQGLHRSATWTEGKEYCNMMVVTTNDSLEHTFDDIFEDETKLAQTREEQIEIYQELLNNNSMMHFTVNGKSVRPVKVSAQNADKVLDAKSKAMTKVANIMGVLKDLDEELQDIIYSTIQSNGKTSVKSRSTKGKKFNPFGEPEMVAKAKAKTSKLTPQKKEKILRVFVETAVMIPAIAREQDVTLEEFDFWEEFNIDAELFFDVYNSSWMFKDRIDAIYSLCEDEDYMLSEYIDKCVI
jgi:hypothetical protein